MKCIIVDDEPIAREGIETLIREIPRLELAGCFDSAESAFEFIKENDVDLIFLDIQMPGINGLEFAENIPGNTLIIFTTAFSEYALDSYEVDAVDYLIKPIEAKRFHKAVEKAITYHSLLISAKKENIKEMNPDYIFIKSERRYFKIKYDDILFIEGLKDYVIIQTAEKRIITKMFLSTIHELLPNDLFFRINKSYIVNLDKIESFDNNDIFIKEYEIAIGNKYREDFFNTYLSGKMNY